MNKGEHRSDFAQRKDNGQFLAILRTDELEDRPLAFEGLLIEKLDPVQVNGERTSGNVLNIDEIEKELSDLPTPEELQEVVAKADDVPPRHQPWRCSEQEQAGQALQLLLLTRGRAKPSAYDPS
jgi:hypothetical protein